MKSKVTYARLEKGGAFFTLAKTSYFLEDYFTSLLWFN